jgi:hypothetical protein
MEYRTKVALFAALAAVAAACSAPIIANDAIRLGGFIVVPLLVMGILLFVAGYYAGETRRRR